MSNSPIKSIITILILLFTNLLYCQEGISSKDLVNHLYDHHTISFELKNNEKKGHVFVDFLSDENYQYEISLLDRIPINVIDSEDILKITIKDTSQYNNVIQNNFDKGINDIQDFNKNMILEFSKVIQTSKTKSIKPVYSFGELKYRVFVLQKEKAEETAN